MISSFSKKKPELRDTVSEMVEVDARARRLAAARRYLPLYLARSIGWLFEEIRNAYLRDLISDGLIDIATSECEVFVPTIGPVKLGMLTIKIGSDRIAITPYTRDLEQATLLVTSSTNRETFELFCSFSDEQPKWMTPAREIGLRSAIRSYLPEKAIEVDQETFRELINRSLCGRQPIFSLGLEQIAEAAAHMLDAITSPQVRSRLALGVKSSALEIGKQISLAAPLLKNSAINVLPKRQPHLLLPLQRTDPSKPPELSS